MAIPVLLDTDIATDVDDLLALLTVAGSPELELVGITTTYGDTLLRARIARQVCDWLGLSVPIGAGIPDPLSGADVWYAGHEAEQLWPGQAAATFQPDDAVELMHETARRYDSELAIIAIGPLTNLAVALQKDPRLADRLRALTVMGGAFGPSGHWGSDPRSPSSLRPEHNVGSDARAAALVVEHAAHAAIVGLDQTRRVQLPRRRLDALTHGQDHPLGMFFQREVDRWMRFNHDDAVLLHDPVTVATLLCPDRFTFASGLVEIAQSPAERAGLTRMVRNRPGSTRVAVDLEPEVLATEVERRISEALSRAR